MQTSCSGQRPRDLKGERREERGERREIHGQQESPAVSPRSLTHETGDRSGDEIWQKERGGGARREGRQQQGNKAATHGEKEEKEE